MYREAAGASDSRRRYSAVYRCGIAVTKIPSVRNEFVLINNRLLLHCLDAENNKIDKRDLLLASSIETGGEFELLLLYFRRSNEMDFDYTVSFLFKTLMYLMEVPPEEIDGVIEEVSVNGRELFETIRGQLDKFTQY